MVLSWFLLELVLNISYTNTLPVFKNKLLGNWRDIPKLKMCNLKYDTTPSKLITMIIYKSDIKTFTYSISYKSNNTYK